MELLGLSGGTIRRDTVHVIVLLAAVILVAVLADLGILFSSEIRTRIRSRAAKRMINRTLKMSVQRTNAQQAAAALRSSPKSDVEPLESEAARTELLQRIEVIRIRAAALSNNRHGSPKEREHDPQLQIRAAEVSAISEIVLLERAGEARGC